MYIHIHIHRLLLAAASGLVHCTRPEVEGGEVRVAQRSAWGKRSWDHLEIWEFWMNCRMISDDFWDGFWVIWARSDLGSDESGDYALI